MSRINYLKLNTFAAALLVTGCAGVQPRLSFNDMMSRQPAAERDSREVASEKPPIEMNGSLEKGNMQFNFKFPLFVW